jgi:hypothetical protein
MQMNINQNLISQLETNVDSLFNFTFNAMEKYKNDELLQLGKRMEAVASALEVNRECIKKNLKERGIELHSESKIASDVIRETFYNAIPQAVQWAIDEKLISQKQIEEQEDFIYTAIPALTFIVVLKNSKNEKKGIRMCDSL